MYNLNIKLVETFRQIKKFLENGNLEQVDLTVIASDWITAISSCAQLATKISSNCMVCNIELLNPY